MTRGYHASSSSFSLKYMHSNSSISTQTNARTNTNKSSPTKAITEIDQFSSVVTPHVEIGIKPSPLTSALMKTDRLLVESLSSAGYDCVVLPITNARYKGNCKNYFLEFRKRNMIHGLNTSDDAPTDGNSTSEYHGRSSSYSSSIMDTPSSGNDPNFSYETSFDHENGTTQNNTESVDEATYDLDILDVPYPELSEVNVVNGPHISKTVGLLSSWVELDNENGLINEFSLQVISNEVSYAQYIGIHSLLIAPPKNMSNLQIYAANINTILEKFPEVCISVSLPMCEDSVRDPTSGKIIPTTDPFSTWDVWNSIRIQCNYNMHLSVSLGSPKTNISQNVVDRWLLEPVRFYLLSSYRFIPNSKHYPVLNKFNQLIIWKFIQRKALYPPVLLLHGIDKLKKEFAESLNLNVRSSTGSRSQNSEMNPDDDKSSKSGNTSFLEYLRYLVGMSYKNNQLLPLENFTINNFLSLNLSFDKLMSPESLQSPLSPLTVNLDNNTYNVFEQDHAKYDAYERAIIAALRDLSAIDRFSYLSQKIGNNNKSCQTLKFGSDNANDLKLKILVVGSGRGPLIKRLFSAIEKLDLNINHISITTIEKNPNAIIYLQERNRERWGNRVTIYNCDVRHWKPTYEAEVGFHLVISEMLGSFGCNELAPECLDSIQRYCDRKNCIFIPQEFTSYVAPVISPSLFSKVCRIKDKHKFDRPYLPVWDEMDLMSTDYAKVWTFNSKTCLTVKDYSIFDNKHNKRQAHVILKCHRKGTIHGLIGYFSAILYKRVEISTCPTGLGPEPRNLVSWLPIYFPIEQPIYITDDQELSIFMKREYKDTRVWYEWSMEAFIYLLSPSQRLSTSISNDQSSAISGKSAEASQVRVRTAATRIHNPAGKGYCMKLC